MPFTLNAKYVESLLRDIVISRGIDVNDDEELPLINCHGVVLSGDNGMPSWWHKGGTVLSRYIQKATDAFNNYINENYFLEEVQDNIYDMLDDWLETYCKTDGNYIIINPIINYRPLGVPSSEDINASASIIEDYFESWHLWAEEEEYGKGVSVSIPLERFAVLTYLNDTPYTQGIVKLQGRTAKEDLDKGKEAFYTDGV